MMAFTAHSVVRGKKSWSEGGHSKVDVSHGLPQGQKFAEDTNYVGLVSKIVLVECYGLAWWESFFFGHSTVDFHKKHCIMSSVTGFDCRSSLLTV